MTAYRMARLLGLIILVPLACVGVASLLQREAIKEGQAATHSRPPEPTLLQRSEVIEECHYGAAWYRIEVRRHNGARRAHGMLETWWADGHPQLQAKCVDSPLPVVNDVDRLDNPRTLVIDSNYLQPLLFWSHEFILKGELILDGDFAVWYSDGQPQIRGQYKNGKRVGLWTLWDREGWRSEEGAYVEGVPDGTWTRWKKSGDILGTAEFVKGTGTYTTWHDNNRVSSVQAFRQGTPHGVLRCWYSDGTLAGEEEYADGLLHGPCTFYLNGKPAQRREYDRGRPNGEWTAWDKNGVEQCRAKYEDGALRSGRFSDDWPFSSWPSVSGKSR
jgi:antitoxin component YwqK of YwqJK toxin-antitoxin module